MLKATVQVVDLSKGWEQYKRGLKRLQGSYVTVGVDQTAEPYPGGQSVAEVALWNEFGTRDVPERSFLRSSVDQNKAKIDQWTGDVVRASEEGKPVDKALESLGFRVQQLVQNKIRSNVPPPYGTGRHGATSEEIAKRQIAKRRRGAIMGDTTLVETGHLMKSITYHVKLGRGAK